MKWWWRVMRGGDGLVWMRWWPWWSCTFANVRWERGLGAKSHETKHDGLILGTPCRTAVEGDRGRWWCGVDEVAAAAQPRV